jgi:hypothetical protein
VKQGLRRKGIIEYAKKGKAIIRIGRRDVSKTM